jgi:hypothetical protein
MNKKIILVPLILVSTLNSQAMQNKIDRSEADSLYAKQRREMQEFRRLTEIEIANCKKKIAKWYSTESGLFFQCRDLALKKLTEFNNQQEYEACTTLKFKCRQ